MSQVSEYTMKANKDVFAIVEEFHVIIPKNCRDAQDYQTKIRNQLYKVNQLLDDNGLDDGFNSFIYFMHYFEWIKNVDIGIDTFELLEDKDFFTSVHTKAKTFFENLTRGVPQKDQDFIFYDSQGALSKAQIYCEATMFYTNYFDGKDFKRDEDFELFLRFINLYWPEIDDSSHANYQTQDFSDFAERAKSDLIYEEKKKIEKQKSEIENKISEMDTDLTSTVVMVATTLWVIVGVCSLGFMMYSDIERGGGVIYTVFMGLIAAVIGIGGGAVMIGVASGLFGWVARSLATAMGLRGKDYKELKVQLSCIDIDEAEVNAEQEIERIESMMDKHKKYIERSFWARDQVEKLLTENDVYLSESMVKEGFKWTYVFTYLNDFEDTVCKALKISADELYYGKVNHDEVLKKTVGRVNLIRERGNNIIQQIVRNGNESKKIAA